MFDFSNFANLKPSIMNWVLVGLMAITFIAAAKFAVNHYADVPVIGKFKDLVNAA